MTVNNRDLTIVRTFKAPIKDVFKAWTDPEILAQWWGPSGVTNPTCQLDVRPGGEMFIVMLAGKDLGDLAGNEWPMSGTYVEVTEPYKLVFRSRALIDGKPILETLNTVTFSEEGENTKMTLSVVVTQTTPEAEGPLSGMKIGWTQSINKLEDLF